MFTTIYSIDPGETTGLASARIFDNGTYGDVKFAVEDYYPEALKIMQAWIQTDMKIHGVVLIEGVPEYQPEQAQVNRVMVASIFFRDYITIDESHIIKPGTWKPMGKRFLDHQEVAGKSVHVKDAWGMMMWWAATKLEWRENRG